MNALALFVASFAVVFGLGVQQLHVTADRRRLAFVTSLFIGGATLVQFKVLPGPTTWVEIAAYLLGSACGIVTSMWAYPLLFKRRLAQATAHLPAPSPSAVRLGETLRLGTQIADYASRSDIESFCLEVTRDGARWWDTQHTHCSDEADHVFVHNAAAYLHLRGHLVRHKEQPHLVRFAP